MSPDPIFIRFPEVIFCSKFPNFIQANLRNLTKKIFFLSYHVMRDLGVLSWVLVFLTISNLVSSRCQNVRKVRTGLGIDDLIWFFVGCRHLKPMCARSSVMDRRQCPNFEADYIIDGPGLMKDDRWSMICVKLEPKSRFHLRLLGRDTERSVGYYYQVSLNTHPESQSRWYNLG